MLIRAEQRYIRTSPTKRSFVAHTIKGVKAPLKAIAYLEMVQKRSAEPLAKAIKQALGNAKNSYGILPEDLLIKELMVQEGPNYKRGRARSRGMIHPILKQTSHIRVILESVEKKVVESKKIQTQEKQEKVEDKKGASEVKNIKAKVKTTVKKSKGK